MKRMFLLTALSLGLTAAIAQDNSYVVKTKGAKKVTAKTAAQRAASIDEDAEPKDFMDKFFPYKSMCDWTDGMRFMVVPEKYDLLVNTFHDAETGKEVNNAYLRHYIMVYKGHEDMPNGRVHIFFFCETDNKSYYYELPNGTFDDYCYGKAGVPTLAYLGDVDTARAMLKNQVLLTRTRVFRVDVDTESDDYREVTMPKNKVVKVVAVGVGTRSYPVKIVVEDGDGKQFYQNVAMSKTNSGLRDNEFELGNEAFLFSGSFEFTGAELVVSRNYNDYLSQTVHTKIATEMSSKGSGKVRDVKVPRFTGFIIDEIRPIKNSEYYTLTLRETETRRIYYKDITFSDKVALADGNRDDFFGVLFGMGEGQAHSTTLETRTAIREGRVIPGMTQEEVELAVGEAATKIKNGDGRWEWLYNRSNGVLLVVEFDEDGIVKKAGGRAGKPSSTQTPATSRRLASQSSSGQRLSGRGTQISK